MTDTSQAPVERVDTMDGGPGLVQLLTPGR